MARTADAPQNLRCDMTFGASPAGTVGNVSSVHLQTRFLCTGYNTESILKTWSHLYYLIG
jgi:hypothetical protein